MFLISFTRQIHTMITVMIASNICVCAGSNHKICIIHDNVDFRYIDAMANLHSVLWPIRNCNSGFLITNERRIVGARNNSSRRAPRNLEYPASRGRFPPRGLISQRGLFIPRLYLVSYLIYRSNGFRNLLPWPISSCRSQP